jgi:hypothetical protein
MTVRYPIAVNPELALSAPAGRASREREACELAGEAVEFVRELSGPAFDTREAALAVYAGKIDETGSGLVQPEDRFCELMELVVPVEGKRPARGGQAQPVFAGGRRWPKPERTLRTVWRLSVGYWRPLTARTPEALEQARKLRRRDDAEQLDADTLRRVSRMPLRAVKPQQPLDIGLFETTLPENPSIIIPDE